jgi:hypothetical protein
MKQESDGKADTREISYLIHLVESQFKFMYGKAHGLVYLLDPRFIGEGMDSTIC